MDTSNITSVRKFEPNLNLICGSGLAGLSALLTLGLFLSLAQGNPLNQMVIGCLAILLEMGKVLLIRRKGWFKIIGLSLVLISGISSFGSALMVVEANKSSLNKVVLTEAQGSYGYKVAMAEIESLDSQVAISIERLKAMPTNYVSASKELLAGIEGMRARREMAVKALEETRTQTPAGSAPVTMFNLIAKASSVDESLVLLSILMLFSILLELSIIALTQNYSTPVPKSHGMFQPETEVGERVEDSSKTRLPPCNPASPEEAHRTVAGLREVNNPIFDPSGPPSAFHGAPEREISADEFLEELGRGLPFPALRGRNATAERIGLPYYRAQVLVRELLKDGRIKVEGKRLVRTNMSYHVPSQAGGEQFPVPSLSLESQGGAHG